MNNKIMTHQEYGEILLAKLQEEHLKRERTYTRKVLFEKYKQKPIIRGYDHFNLDVYVEDNQLE
jgi:hypothetical protein